VKIHSWGQDGFKT